MVRIEDRVLSGHTWKWLTVHALELDNLEDACELATEVLCFDRDHDFFHHASVPDRSEYSSNDLQVLPREWGSRSERDIFARTRHWRRSLACALLNVK